MVKAVFKDTETPSDKVVVSDSDNDILMSIAEPFLGQYAAD